MASLLLFATFSPLKIHLFVSDGKHSSNINDVFRSEQKSQFETKSNWPTDDSFSGAGELENFEQIRTSDESLNFSPYVRKLEVSLLATKPTVC
jgi:hypothetical protein